MPKYKFDQIAYNINDKKMPEPGDEEMYIGLEHLDSGSLRVTRWGSDVPIKGQKLLMKKGDILFGRRNTYLRRAAIAPHDGIFSAHGMIFRPKTEVIDEKYFPFFIASDYFMDEAIRISVGSLSPTVNWKTLKELEFVIPELDEQKRLAEILTAADETRESYKKLLAKTDELVKSQFIEMFGDPVTDSKKRGQVPFSTFMTGIRYGTSQPPKFSENGEYRFIRATNIKSGRIQETDMLRIARAEADKIEKCKLDGGEIIIVRSGANTGDTCVVTEKYAGDYAGYDIIVSLNRDMANPVYFNELLNTHYMQLIVKPLTARSAQPHLNAKQVQDLPILQASLEEQTEFQRFVEQSDKSKFVVSNRNLSRCLAIPETISVISRFLHSKRSRKANCHMELRQQQ